MEAAGGGGNVVLLMNPAQARRLGMAQTTTGDFAFGSPAEAASKFGISRIIVSTTVPAGTIIAVDADWFATATGDSPRFAVSNEATLHEEDTAPLPLVTGAQGIRRRGQPDEKFVPDQLDRHSAVALRDLVDGSARHGANSGRRRLVAGSLTWRAVSSFAARPFRKDK